MIDRGIYSSEQQLFIGGRSLLKWLHALHRPHFHRCPTNSHTVRYTLVALIIVPRYWASQLTYMSKISDLQAGRHAHLQNVRHGDGQDLGPALRRAARRGCAHLPKVPAAGGSGGAVQHDQVGGRGGQYIVPRPSFVILSAITTSSFVILSAITTSSLVFVSMAWLRSPPSLSYLRGGHQRAPGHTKARSFHKQRAKGQSVISYIVSAHGVAITSVNFPANARFTHACDLIRRPGCPAGSPSPSTSPAPACCRCCRPATRASGPTSVRWSWAITRWPRSRS